MKAAAIPLFTSPFLVGRPVAPDEMEYVLSIYLPGTGIENMRVEARPETLQVRCERPRSFQRSFAMPTDAAVDRMEATYDEGVLRIAVPRRAPAA